MEDKPFALLGVNIFHETPEELKEVMTREKLNWRSFVGAGEVARQWNSPATPAFYVIDHSGTIRRKWIGHPGEKTIDTALEKLMHEAKADSQ